MIPPANTGKDSKSRKAVIKIAQTNRGHIYTKGRLVKSETLILFDITEVVAIKLIAPRIEDMPAKCSEKIAMSTLLDEWLRGLERGGYTVQPVPTPDSIFRVRYINKKEAGNSQ